jgi:hypothetical protein
MAGPHRAVRLPKKDHGRSMPDLKSPVSLLLCPPASVKRNCLLFFDSLRTHAMYVEPWCRAEDQSD